MTSTITQHRPPLNVEQAAEYLGMKTRFIRRLDRPAEDRLLQGREIRAA